MGYFDTIYHDDELPHSEKAVYMYLKDRAGLGSVCWPAVRTEADLHLGRSTVKRALHDLIHTGLRKSRAIVRMGATPPIGSS
jgi:GntR family transcriptional regulator